MVHSLRRAVSALSKIRTRWTVPFAGLIPLPRFTRLIPGGLFAIGIPLFIKESPRWLMARDRRSDAIKNLCYLRQLSPEDQYIVSEVNEIDMQVESDRRTVGRGFWGPFRQVFGTSFLFRRMMIT